MLMWTSKLARGSLQWQSTTSRSGTGESLGWSEQLGRRGDGLDCDAPCPSAAPRPRELPSRPLGGSRSDCRVSLMVRPVLILSCRREGSDRLLFGLPLTG